MITLSLTFLSALFKNTFVNRSVVDTAYLYQFLIVNVHACVRVIISMHYLLNGICFYSFYRATAC